MSTPTPAELPLSARWEYIQAACMLLTLLADILETMSGQFAYILWSDHGIASHKALSVGAPSREPRVIGKNQVELLFSKSSGLRMERLQAEDCRLAVMIDGHDDLENVRDTDSSM